jgi:hypothetical protein
MTLEELLQIPAIAEHVAAAEKQQQNATRQRCDAILAALPEIKSEQDQALARLNPAIDQYTATYADFMDQARQAAAAADKLLGERYAVVATTRERTARLVAELRKLVPDQADAMLNPVNKLDF